jgi:6,7-dimethyl-8-ribityllumazine synthase
MTKIYQGSLIGTGIKIGIVVSRFNEFITSKLLGGALDTLERHGVSLDDIEVAWVPGSFEIPIAADRMASSMKYDVVICLGALIRGSTPHFDYIAAEASKGIGQVGLKTGVPTIFERAGTKAGNKGSDAAMTAIEMVNLFKQLS